jgi:hypothetical protein
MNIWIVVNIHIELEQFNEMVSNYIDYIDRMGKKTENEKMKVKFYC